MAQIYHANLTSKSQAKRLTDFLLWGNKPDTLEAELTQALGEMGVARKKADV